MFSYMGRAAVVADGLNVEGATEALSSWGDTGTFLGKNDFDRVAEGFAAD